MMPVTDRTALIQPMLPDDPIPGQVYTLPEGQIVGGANVLNVYKGSKLIGATTNLVPISNVSGKYYMERLSSVIPLKEKDVVRVLAQQFNFNEITFIEFFGWVGTGALEVTNILSDKHYRILAAIPIGPSETNFQLYEKVCVEVIQGAKK